MHHVRSIPSSDISHMQTENLVLAGLGLAMAAGVISAALLVWPTGASPSVMTESVRVMSDISLLQIAFGITTIVNSLAIYRILGSLKKSS